MSTHAIEPCPMCRTASMMIREKNLFCTSCAVYIGKPETFGVTSGFANHRMRPAPHIADNTHEQPEVRFFDFALILFLSGVAVWIAAFASLM